MKRANPKERSDYRHFDQMETRWNDNDIYGHMNNVVYYEIFDSVINRYLVKKGKLNITSGPVAAINEFNEIIEISSK